MLLPVNPPVLIKNLGIPIVVVGCKVSSQSFRYFLLDGYILIDCILLFLVSFVQSDHIPQLEKEYNYKEAHFDYISQYIRRICLQCKQTIQRCYVYIYIYSLSTTFSNTPPYLSFIYITDGAAFIYTSAKKDNNCNVLLDYIRYTLYNFEMTQLSQVTHLIFLPSSINIVYYIIGPNR